MAIAAAPKVEAATAAAARPRAAPNAVSAVSSGRAAADAAPRVSAIVAAPPTERGSLMDENSTTAVAAAESQPALSVEALRATHMVSFEAPGACIVGPVERNLCERLCRCFSERSFLSLGEAKRYIVVADSNIFVYMDVTDPSPLYTIPLTDLPTVVEEDRNHPHFYSHTISPEANVGLPFDTKSKHSLRTALLLDENGTIAYQFAFDTSEVGGDALDRFISAVSSANGTKKKGGK